MQITSRTKARIRVIFSKENNLENSTYMHTYCQLIDQFGSAFPHTRKGNNLLKDCRNKSRQVTQELL
jgi:hypothetical protein